MFAFLLRNADHAAEHRHQPALRWCDERVGDLRLLPEDLPVRLLGRLCAVQLRLAHATARPREELAEWYVHRAHASRIHRVGTTESRDLRRTEEERVAL